MDFDDILEEYPKPVKLKDGSEVTLRPLQAIDEEEFHKFFVAVPEKERIHFKHRVTDRSIIHEWCQHIDYGRILPMLALSGNEVVGDASLHQSLGGWKRHIGRVSVAVHPSMRGKGLATIMVRELIEIARNVGLEKLEAEFLSEMKSARYVFGELGFHEIVAIPEYVKDMQANSHDYVLMGRHITTDEEYAGMG